MVLSVVLTDIVIGNKDQNDKQSNLFKDLLRITDYEKLARPSQNQTKIKKFSPL
jgi:hypothetical protein